MRVKKPGAALILILGVFIILVESSDFLLPWNDDVLGLIVFKADLHDPKDSLASWVEDSSNPCNWTGIQCDPLNSRVVGIHLENLGISGPIGRGLGKLDRLENLTLAKNNFSGNIPAEIPESLKHLNLSYNSLSGDIPVFGNIGGNNSFGNVLQVVDLSGNSLTGEVIFLNCSSLRFVSLSGNRLTGQVPYTAGSCNRLETLVISDNKLSGNIPTTIGSLTRLRTLDLSHNALTGSIPPELGLCFELSVLDLSYNLLSGDIPASLQSLSQLSVLRLLGNSFTGNIPDWIGDFLELLELNIGENQLTGQIPFTIGFMKSLEKLSIHKNSLQGGIPLNISGCFRLSCIDLSSNNLTGSIPDELFELSRNTLKILDLSYNQLTGDIPERLTEYPYLESLNLSGNTLHGSVPYDLGGLQNLNLSSNYLTGYIPRIFPDSLNILKLDHNSLVGIIPQELGNVSSLRYLDLSSNNLTGSIPMELAGLSNLETLDLSYNHLTGNIPVHFGQLQNLTMFNVSHNSLAGPVPSDGIFPLLDPSSFTGNARLCGAAMGIDCPPIPKPIVLNPNATTESSPIISSHRASNKIVFSVSAIVAISAAAVIALGIVVVSILNLRTQAQTRPRASFYVVDSLPGSSPSEDLAVGKLVMFTDDSDSKDEDLLPTAQALLNKNYEIGRGSFGTVYKATLAAGRTVAVKKLSIPGLVSIQEEFERRVQFLGKIQHENLVNFQGYYFTPKLQLLMYDFIPNGNVFEKLHEGKHGFPWELRFKVAFGTASAICYLHHKCRPRVIHYNLKSSNILLDDQFNPRVSDYGLAKLLHSRDRFVVMTKYQSGFGYLAPEFTCEGFKVNEKCDVYGFGVILLEIITGKMPVEYSEDDVSILSDYVRSVVDEGDPLRCVDQGLMGLFPEDEVLTLIKLGLVCTSQVPSNRPSMTEVVQILELIKPLC